MKFDPLITGHPVYRNLLYWFEPFPKNERETIYLMSEYVFCYKIKLCRPGLLRPEL